MMKVLLTLRVRTVERSPRLINHSPKHFASAMSETLKARIQIFDPKQCYSVRERRLPHWSQAGTICFITWRTWDSIPVHVLQAWLAERDAWLRQQGIDPQAPDCTTQLRNRNPELLEEFQRRLSDRWNAQLDACHGACACDGPIWRRSSATVSDILTVTVTT